MGGGSGQKEFRSNTPNLQPYESPGIHNRARQASCTAFRVAALLQLQYYEQIKSRASDLGGESEGGVGVASMRRHRGHVAEHERLSVAAERVLQQHRQLGVPARAMSLFGAARDDDEGL